MARGRTGEGSQSRKRLSGVAAGAAAANNTRTHSLQRRVGSSARERAVRKLGAHGALGDVGSLCVTAAAVDPRRQRHPPPPSALARLFLLGVFLSAFFVSPCDVRAAVWEMVRLHFWAAAARSIEDGCCARA